MAITCRRAEAQDAPDIDNLCTQLHGKEDMASKLMETALLCFVAIEEQSNQVVGFLCIDDACSTRLDGNSDTQAWLETVPHVKSARIVSTAYVVACALIPDFELEACPALMKAAMTAAPALEHLFMVTSDDITFQEPGLASVFNRIVSSRDPISYLYEAEREAIIPRLLIRRAAVEDHDDMLPLLESAGQRLPALAKLPESSRPEEAFALTRIVAGQDEHNSVFVSIAETTIVGFMVVTAEVDTSSLGGAFDLHPYDNFLHVEEYERRKQAATDSLMEYRIQAAEDQLKREHARKVQSFNIKNGIYPDDENEEEGGEEGEGGGEGEVAEGEENVAPKMPELDISTVPRPSEEEVKEEMARLFPGGGSAEEGNLFAITMLCMEEPYDQQAVEFLSKAFEEFPEREYCVLTLPHSSREPPLVRFMTRLTPLPGSIFPEVLYVFNRNALHHGFDVHLPRDGDAEGVSMLVAGMPDSEDTKALLEAARERGTAVVATCGGEVVALVTINPTVDLPLLQTNFCVSKLLDLSHHPAERHGEIDMYCMNPIFAHLHREFLVAAQRLLKRSALYYALPPGQPPPDMLGCMQQVPPRHHAIPADRQANFALYLFNRRSALSYKTVINAQVLVVGASECGLAAIESLLLCPTHTFNFITLLAPGGISVGGVACEFTAGVISKMGLEASVMLLDAEMVGLDREQQLVEVNDGSQIPYDLLLLTAGMQEQTRNELAVFDPDAAGAVMSVTELASDFSFADSQSMNHIQIYGNTLESYHALAILEKRGASDLIHFCAPPGEQHPYVSVMRELAARMGSYVPEPKRSTLIKLESMEGNIRPKALFETVEEDGTREETAVLDLMVSCRPVDVSKNMFYCLNDSGIVYDGRVVVDNSFRTNDAKIYAAGTMSKLSRRFGYNVQYEHYSSTEVGGRLAESVVASFSETTLPRHIPPLLKAKSVGCNLPGGMVFVMTGTPLAMADPSLEPPEGGNVLSTTTDRGSFQLTLDAASRVHQITYFGLDAAQVLKLSSLIGLHKSYLNNVVEKYEAGQVSCLVSYFTDTEWAMMMFHDHFPAFRAAMLQQFTSTGKASDPTGLRSETQDAALEFIRVHLAELPSYHLPQTA